MTAAEIADREIRSYLLAKGRSGVTNSRVRIQRNGEVHVFGPLRKEVRIGWFFAGSRADIAEKIALERIDDDETLSVDERAAAAETIKRNDEPFYVRQTAEPEALQATTRWFREAAEEARREGAAFARYSIAEDKSALLIEAWEKRPADMGEQRWMLAAVKSRA